MEKVYILANIDHINMLYLAQINGTEELASIILEILQEYVAKKIYLSLKI